MAAPFEYRDVSTGEWHLRVLLEKWSDDLWQRLLSVIDQQSKNRRPRTVMLDFVGEHNPDRLFLKTFHEPSGIDVVKDFFRDSKAFRFLRQGLALSAAGFLVPAVIAAGEQRSRRLLRRAFVLTLSVQGEPSPAFLTDRYIDRGLSLTAKRAALVALGRQIRRLHELGFIHGDLAASNIIVASDTGGGVHFYLMDNDRTRQYPPWLAQLLRKRNLAQLNRSPLPGITLQDRMRFFRAYSGRRHWGAAERRLLRWLENKARQQRKELDAAEPFGSFRRLMSWKPRIEDNL